MPHPFVSLYAKFEGATMKTVGGDSFCRNIAGRTDRRTDGRTYSHYDIYQVPSLCNTYWVFRIKLRPVQKKVNLHYDIYQVVAVQLPYQVITSMILDARHQCNKIVQSIIK